jgi:hypothetical protein
MVLESKRLRLSADIWCAVLNFTNSSRWLALLREGASGSLTFENRSNKGLRALQPLEALGMPEFRFLPGHNRLSRPLMGRARQRLGMS